jgi:hypothetical protein
MTQKELELVEKLIDLRIEYQLETYFPTRHLWEIANDLEDVEKELTQDATKEA